MCESDPGILYLFMERHAPHCRDSLNYPPISLESDKDDERGETILLLQVMLRSIGTSREGERRVVFVYICTVPFSTNFDLQYKNKYCTNYKVQMYNANSYFSHC